MKSVALVGHVWTGRVEKVSFNKDLEFTSYSLEAHCQEINSNYHKLFSWAIL